MVVAVCVCVCVCVCVWVCGVVCVVCVVCVLCVCCVCCVCMLCVLCVCAAHYLYVACYIMNVQCYIILTSVPHDALSHHTYLHAKCLCMYLTSHASPVNSLV